MKKTLLTLILLPLASATAQDLIIVGCDFEQGTNRDLPNYTATGVDRATYVQAKDPVTGDPLFDEFGDPILEISSKNTFLQNFTFNGTQTSSDTTWGNLSLDPAPFSEDADVEVSISTKFRDGDGSSVQDLVVKLLPGFEYTLKSLHFDYKTPFNTSPKNITVSYISGLDDAEIVLWQRVAAGSNAADNMDAFAGVDIDLGTFLTDLVLSGEETLVFRFDMSADVAGGKAGASFMDNIALVSSGGGSTVSEWAGYPWATENGDVDTLSFLGWVNVLSGDWIWSYSLGQYIYCPEEFVSVSGAWTYIP
jgi:hypothetical protein